MEQLTQQAASNGNAIEVRRVAGGYEAQEFDLDQRIGQAMAMSKLLPEHLRHDDAKVRVATCIQIASIARSWRANPYQVAPETFLVGGKLGFSGKLIASAVNSSGKLDGNLRYRFEGVGDKRKVIVIGRLKGETEDREVELTLEQGRAAGKNHMWKSDPDQKLVYSGALRWARRHTPELVTGILSDDEVVAIAREAPAERQAKTQDLTDRLMGDDVVEGKVVEKPQDEPTEQPAQEAPHFTPDSPECSTFATWYEVAAGVLAEAGHDADRIKAALGKAKLGVANLTATSPVGRAVRAWLLNEIVAGRFELEGGGE